MANAIRAYDFGADSKAGVHSLLARRAEGGGVRAGPGSAGPVIERRETVVFAGTGRVNSAGFLDWTRVSRACDSWVSERRARVS